MAGVVSDSIRFAFLVVLYLSSSSEKSVSVGGVVLKGKWLIFPLFLQNLLQNPFWYFQICPEIFLGFEMYKDRIFFSGSWHCYLEL